MVLVLLFFGPCPLSPWKNPLYAFCYIFKVSGRQAQAASNMLAEIPLLVLEYLPLNTKGILLDPWKFGYIYVTPLLYKWFHIWKERAS